MQNETPLISVIIPAYNHENYIQDTIKSIINQTYYNIELIIINDGSKDTTWGKINELKNNCIERFTNVIFETQENQGTCKTLNKLLNLAKGEFIYLIASDDLAMPDALSTLSNFLLKNEDYALAVGDNEFIDGDSIRVYWDKETNNVYDTKKATYKTFKDYFNAERPDVNFNSSDFGDYGLLLFGNYVPNGYLIRKSIFEKFPQFTTAAPLEDYYLMLQISKYAKMKYIDKILFSYRWHNDNTSKNREKMVNMTKKTREYENELIKSINIFELDKNVQFAIKYGYTKNLFSIPFVFKIFKTKSIEHKCTFINILGIKFKVRERKL